MRKKYISFVLILTLVLIPSAKAAKIAADVEDFVGTWSLYDESNNLIDSIEVELLIAKKKTARFDFKQASQIDSTESSLKGFIVDSNLVVFNLIELGFSKTYVVRVDFNAASGPGFELQTELATCTVVGEDKDLVKKKNRKRLSTDSAQCNYASFNDGTSRAVKLVKDGVSPASVSATADTDQSILDDFSGNDTLLSGAWITSGKSSSRRFLVKDVATNHLGNSFVYRQINQSTKLANLDQADFLSGEKIGLHVSDYLIFSTARFGSKEELFILKLNKKSGSGNLFKTPNGDCFSLKNPITSTRLCTPNDSSNFVSNVTRQLGSRKVKKINTNVTISF